MEKKNKFGIIVALGALFSIGAMAQVTEPPPEMPAPVSVERLSLRMGELGIRYIPTLSSLELRSANGDRVYGDFTASHGYGVMLGANFSKNVGLQAEVNYLEITQKYRDRYLDRQLDVSYLNIPVMLSVNTDKTRMVNLNFVAGPQLGINVGSKIESSSYENTEAVHAVVGANGSDVGLAYGTGLEFALGRKHCARLDLGYRGFYGLFDVSGKQSYEDPDTYSVVVRASRRTHAAYLGLTWCF